MSSSATVAGRYQQLATVRSPYLQRARECAELTIPSLMPPEGSSGATNLPTPYQGMGARGVNNLASKLLLALLPPNQPFFRLMIDDFTIQAMTGKEGMRGAIEKALNQIERAVQTEVETTPVRVSVFEALKQLLVTGNVLLYVQPEGGVKVYRLDRYVVKRDPSGNVLEIIVHERISPMVLPEAFQKAIAPGADQPPEEFVDLYTHVKRKGRMYQVYQEVKGKPVPGTKGSWPVDKTPYLPLRWAKLDGEDYGRGHVEEYLGDLRSNEGLSRAIVEGSAAAAKVLFLVNPNGVTSERTISEAPNCAVRSGNKEDVSVLQMEKYADFRIALETVVRIESRLAQAFLLTSSVQRQAERVTAEEIRLMAGELEDALGGVYSILTQEFQLPLVKRLMFQLERAGRLPVLPEGMVRPSIVTGMEALGRGHDLNRLMMFGNVVQQTVGPQVFQEVINPDEFVTRIGTNIGIDMAGLVKTPEQIAAQRQYVQQQALLQKLGPEILRQGKETNGTA